VIGQNIQDATAIGDFAPIFIGNVIDVLFEGSCEFATVLDQERLV
jgi:hypothetical protein